MENFAEKLKKALKEKGLTQGELCEKIGMTPGGLKRMIDHNTTRVDTLQHICKELNIPITYFIEVEIKPEGFWKKMIQDMSDEMNNLRMRAYRAEEIVSKHGLGNFRNVSGRRGVINVAKNRKPVFFRPVSLRFHLQK